MFVWLFLSVQTVGQRNWSPEAWASVFEEGVFLARENSPLPLIVGFRFAQCNALLQQVWNRKRFIGVILGGKREIVHIKLIFLEFCPANHFIFDWQGIFNVHIKIEKCTRWSVGAEKTSAHGRGSNPRPFAWKASTLPLAQPHIMFHRECSHIGWKTPALLKKDSYKANSANTLIWTVRNVEESWKDVWVEYWSIQISAGDHVKKSRFQKLFAQF